MGVSKRGEGGVTSKKELGPPHQSVPYAAADPAVLRDFDASQARGDKGRDLIFFLKSSARARVVKSLQLKKRGFRRARRVVT